MPVSHSWLSKLRLHCWSKVVALIASMYVTAWSGEASDPRPLNPTANPLALEHVNRDRFYDFYTKQALEYITRSDKPSLLPQWPGLDGGKKIPERPNHFGNQSEADWSSDSWNEMDSGSVQAFGMSLNGNRARAVAVRLGTAAAVFDPDTLTWPAAWNGGFVRHGSKRFGFLEGMKPVGDMIPEPGGVPAKRGSFTYHGFYRYGERAVFSYSKDGASWLESASFDGTSVKVQRESVGDGELTPLTRGGPSQWPQHFITTGKIGSAKPYAFDEIPYPEKTPWNSLWHFGDHDFFADGSAALCTFEGEVWLVSGLDSDLKAIRWKRFAAGLNQLLGLRIVDEKIYVLGRDQITCLHDLNGDEEADFYECICNAYNSSATGHDFITGLQCDSLGRFLFASGLQGVVRTSADRRSVEVLATGLRNPNGIGLSSDGLISVTPQEGDWTPASMLCEFSANTKVPPHFGYRGPKPNLGSQGHVPPIAYFPRGEDNSSGGPCYVESTRWGVPAETLVHFSWGMGTMFLVTRERIDDVVQGTVIPLPGNFRSGPHRGRFNPLDGQLYVTGMTGWITYTPDPGSFTRVRYSGGQVQVPMRTEARENGIVVHFAGPIDHHAASVKESYFAQQWNYRYGGSYGSNEYSVRAPDTAGHDPLTIRSVYVFPDNRSLFLEIPDLQPSNILHLYAGIPGLMTQSCYLTLHRLGPPFTDFPGYVAIAKQPLDPHAGHTQLATQTKPKAVPWEQGTAGRPMHLKAIAGLQFDQRELRGKAGERLSLTFENPDAMPHNWVLIDSGREDDVVALANALISDPRAIEMNFVPDSPAVLCHTRLVEPGTSTTIHFSAPKNPGKYPYLCSFPGHATIMRGTLIIE